MFSIRYSSEGLNARLLFMKLCGWLQGKKVVALRSDPEACARVLASSDTKGQFVEDLIACPAWRPVLSIESVDGETWQALSSAFRAVLGKLSWQTRIGPLTRVHLARFAERGARHPGFVMDAEQISRLTANILFELLFDRAMTRPEEDLFYRASLEWRKEIALKGPGRPEVKAALLPRLRELVLGSRFREMLAEHDETVFLSALAQPFILSPQINFSDIMASLFTRFRGDPALFCQAARAARSGDLQILSAMCLESIRLEHPFPVLEREMTRDFQVGDLRLEKGTQVFIMLDEFEQDRTFDPSRWAKPSQNPYRSIPFGAGPRICLGKALATEMLGELLAGLLVHFAPDVLRPEDNHLFSGRDNDGGETLSGSLYQARVFLGALLQSASYGQRARATCPVTGHSA